MKVIHVSDDIVIAIGDVVRAAGMTARECERNAVMLMLGELAADIASEWGMELPVDDSGNVVLAHDKQGKPLMEGLRVSISHTVFKTGGYAAIMLSRRHDVGIDIEYKSERIMKIASRFLRADEQPSNVCEHLVYWCAKEAVYKLYSADDLTYQQMRVAADMTEVTNLKRGIAVPVRTIVNDRFVLVYSFL